LRIEYWMKREQHGPGQESVWDYPRPPRLEQSGRTVVVCFAGQEIARTSNAYRVLETSHPPSWYLPPDSVRKDLLVATAKKSFCEWKGTATYWTVRAGGQTAENAAWSYASPSPAFANIRDYLAFYPNVFDCYVDGERVQPQPGGFYGGWITKELVGPFKGIPGSSGW
jgi:uncharacterized protein (DUF427 family)